MPYLVRYGAIRRVNGVTTDELERQRGVINNLMKRLLELPQDRVLNNEERRFWMPLLVSLSNETHILWAMEMEKA